MNTWLKSKTEASGYPAWADTRMKKQQYIDNYATREGIALDPTQIAKNPGRKATAKLCLNSFWGKFAENLHKSSTSVITSPQELYAAVLNPLMNITSIHICSEERLELVHTSHQDEWVENGKTNIFIAAMTTCWARLELYKYLDQLKNQVLYFDTDSIIYSQMPCELNLPVGDYLGDLTNELDHDDHIVDFTSGGLKITVTKPSKANAKAKCVALP